MKKHMMLAVAAAVLSLVWGSGVVYAMEEHRGADKPCSSDIQKFCKDVKPGGGRIMECLRSHQSELSEACSSRLSKEEPRKEDNQRKCAADVQKFCKDVKPGGGRIIKCLKSHQSDLSEECRGTMPGHGRK